MSVESAIKNQAIALQSLGKPLLNLKYPKEFELYVIALELIDAEGVTLKYFIFPVNPSNIDETSVNLTNTKKTLTGVVSLRNSTFSPIDINLNGTFGRRFRVLLGTDYIDFVSSFTTTRGKLGGQVFQDTAEHGIRQFFDERVKTGYGSLNVLKDMCVAAMTIDNKGPRTLILHNLAFGSTYVVEVISFKTSMTQESNMIHNYSLALKATAPLDALLGTDLKDERFRLSATGYAQTQTNRVVQGLNKIF